MAEPVASTLNAAELRPPYLREAVPLADLSPDQRRLVVALIAAAEAAGTAPMASLTTNGPRKNPNAPAHEVAS
jgi:hypothetical protein